MGPIRALCTGAKIDHHAAVMSKRRGAVSIVVLLVLIAAGFFAWRYVHRLHPEPPPRGAAVTVAPAFTNESSIRVPVAVDVRTIEDIAEQQVPKDLLRRAGISAGHDVTADVVVRRSGRITAEAQQGKIHLRMPVEADITADWRPAGLVGFMARGKPRKIETRATFTIRAEINLGVDKEWNLATATAATLRWEQDPDVQLGPMTVKLSTLAGAQIGEQFNAVVGTIDAQLRERVPMRALISQAWTAAFRTLALDKSGALWLLLRPTGVFLGEVEARDGQVFLDAGIRGVFRVVVGEQPQAAEPAPLPPRSPPPDGPGIALDVPVSVSFEAANQQIDQRVEGQRIEVPVDVVGRSVPLTIGAVEVYPSGDHIAVALEFTADLPGSWFDLSGLVYLVGTPRLDAHNNHLWISDLAYDSRTNLALVDVAEWMLHDTIVRRIQELLVFDFAERLDDYRDKANHAIANYKVAETVRIHGKLGEASVATLTVTDLAIVAMVQLRGEARLEVTPRAPNERSR